MANPLVVKEFPCLGSLKKRSKYQPGGSRVVTPETVLKLRLSKIRQPLIDAVFDLVLQRKGMECRTAKCFAPVSGIEGIYFC